MIGYDWLWSIMIDQDCDVTNINSLRKRNALNIMKDPGMKNWLDPLILIVHLPSVSVTNTSEWLYPHVVMYSVITMRYHILYLVILYIAVNIGV